MDCPKCGLINPDTAVCCDCGYDFKIGEFHQPDPIDPGKIQIPYNSGYAFSRLVTAGLVVIILLHILAIGSEFMMLRFISDAMAGRSISSEEAAALDNHQQLISSLQAFAYIITSILFLLWFRRAYQNLSALGAFNLSYSPAWAVGGFFVPFLNLVRPFQVMTEVWKASDPEQPAWRQAPTSQIIGWWWFLFIGSSILSRVVAEMGSGSDISLSQLQSFSNALIIDELFGAVAAIPAIVLIWNISMRQEQKHKNLILQGRLAVNATM